MSWIGGGAQESKKPGTSAPNVADCRVAVVKDTTQDDAKQREISASGDVVEAALARAIDAEVQTRGSGREARVALLAGELQARRLARDNVAVLDAKRRQRGR